jgi:hypothetical protein
MEQIGSRQQFAAEIEIAQRRIQQTRVQDDLVKGARISHRDLNAELSQVS